MSAPIPTFSDRPKAAPTPKLRALVKYPGNILGGTGIDVTKQHGTVTVDMQWNDFGLQSAIPTSPTNNILTFDTATNQYVMIPSSLLGGAVAGISDVTTGGLYGRQPGSWVPILYSGTGNFLRSTGATAANLAVTGGLTAGSFGLNGGSSLKLFTATDTTGNGVGVINYGAAGSPATMTDSIGSTLFAGFNFLNVANTAPQTASALAGVTHFSSGTAPAATTLATGVIASASFDGTFTPGADSECVPLFVVGTTSRGGAVFGAGIHAAANTTAGSSIQGMEIDVSSGGVNNFLKTGLVIVSPASDVGTTTNTEILAGSGVPLISSHALRITGVSPGAGFKYGISSIQVAGGMQPITDTLWFAGGNTTIRAGFDLSYQNFSDGPLLLANSNYVKARIGDGTNVAPLIGLDADNSVRVGPAGLGNAISVTSGGTVQLATGFWSRSGISGSYAGSIHNFFWTGSSIQAWVDGSNLGTISIISDYRTKKDVAPLPSTWETVKALNPIKYTQAEFAPPSSPKTAEPMFVADDVERWGFVAHELQQTLVESAATGVKDSHDTVQSPNWATIVAALTKGLQEAMARIEALEGQLAKAK